VCEWVCGCVCVLVRCVFECVCVCEWVCVGGFVCVSVVCV